MKSKTFNKIMIIITDPLVGPVYTQSGKGLHHHSDIEFPIMDHSVISHTTHSSLSSQVMDGHNGQKPWMEVM